MFKKISHEKTKNILDGIFELLVTFILILIVFGAFFQVFTGITNYQITGFLEFLKIERIVAIVLNLVLLLKLYKLLLFFIGKHNVVIYDLIEIGITSIIISAIFGNSGISNQKLMLLVILFICGFVMKYGEFHLLKSNIKMDIGIEDKDDEKNS